MEGNGPGLELLCVLKGHEEDQVWCVSWSHDGMYLASCGLDKVVRIWTNTVDRGNWMDYNNVSCIATLEDAQTRSLRSCAWSPDGKLIASASFDGIVIVWECQSKNKSTWEQIASLEGHDSEVKCVSWNYDGSLLATCGRDKKVWIWEKLHAGEYECISVLEGHTQDVKFVKFHPNLQVLFSCSYDDTIKVWLEDGSDWYCSHTIRGHTSTVWGMSISVAGNEIISCSDDLSLMVWTCDNANCSGEWRVIEKLPNAHKFTIYSVDWNRDNGMIASGSGDNSILITSKSLHENIRVMNAHDNDVNCVRWNPNTNFDHLLASCGDDGTVKIWKLSL